MKISKSYFLSSDHVGDSPRSCRYRSFEVCFKVLRSSDLDLELTCVAKASNLSLSETLKIASFLRKWTRFESIRKDYFYKLENILRQ